MDKCYIACVKLYIYIKNLLRNLYPKRLIDKIIKTYLDKKFNNNVQTVPEVETEVRYFRLPYIGERSQAAKQKVKNLIKKYGIDNLSVNLVFTTCKIKDYFSTKYTLLACVKSNTIYLFRCARCNSCYVGGTRKHFNVRRKEHLESDLNAYPIIRNVKKPAILIHS